MDQVRYASYELGRAPVRFELAKKIKERFGLNLAWLAGEAENPRSNWDVPTWVPVDNMLFSGAFDLYIRDAITTYMTKLDGPAIEEIGALTQTSGGLISMGELLRIFDKYKHRWPEPYRDSVLLDHLHRAAEIALALQKGQLTQGSEFRNPPSGMKLTLSALMDKVRKLAKPLGMKARLASELGVPPARVSEWLSGKHDPSGEVTLQLLHWVEQQERKK